MSSATMTKGIGQPVRRKEDARLVIGAGCFSDDVDLPRQTRAFVLRSVHAHARIKGIDTDTRQGAEGRAGGADRRRPQGRRHQADPAGRLDHRAGRGAAQAAGRGAGQQERAVSADAVQPRSPSTRSAMSARGWCWWSPRRSRSPRTPPSWSRSTTSRCRRSPTRRAGGGARRGAALGRRALELCSAMPRSATPPRPKRRSPGAAHVVRLETWVQRVTGVPMEARTAVGHYDKQSGRYFLHAGSGGVVRQKGECAAILGVPPESVQVVARDIGGNFGTKNSLFPEFPLVLWASKRIGRPVKWTCERSEAFLSDYQGRDLVAKVELARRREGQVPGDARLAPEQYRRLRRLDRAAAQGADASAPTSIDIPVAHFQAYRGAQQHHVHDPVSQRRPPGGDLPDGAAVRSRRRQDRHRPHLDPPPQPDRAEGAAVSHRARHQIRQRRIRSRRWTRRIALSEWKEFRQAPPRIAARPASCAASGSPTTSNAPWAIRASGRRSR